jgi:hypothetical protein
MPNRQGVRAPEPDWQDAGRSASHQERSSHPRSWHNSCFRFSVETKQHRKESLMKMAFLCLITLILSNSVFAQDPGTAKAAIGAVPTQALQKLLNLEHKIQSAQVSSCVPDGLDCTSSIECCGSASCWQGVCNSGGASCRGEGATCSSAIECCGSLTCWNGRCSGSASCFPKGALCKSSIECCGSLSCWQGRCD